jgi:hypothetical protein
VATPAYRLPPNDGVCRRSERAEGEFDVQSTTEVDTGDF